MFIKKSTALWSTSCLETTLPIVDAFSVRTHEIKARHTPPRRTVTFHHLILNAARTSQPCFCCSSAKHLKDAARSLGSVAAIYIPLSSCSQDLAGSEQTSNGRREKVGAEWRTSLFFQQVGKTAPTRINAARWLCVSDRLSQGGCCLCLSLHLFQASIW